MLTETQTTVFKFNDLPITGDGIPLLSNVKGWLLCDWNGCVKQYSKTVPTQEQFAPCDKGGLSVFGLNEKGQVILGMAFYKVDNEYVCYKADSTNSWQ